MSFNIGDYIVLKPEYYLQWNFRTRESLCVVVFKSENNISIKILKGKEKGEIMSIGNIKNYIKYDCNIKII